MIYHYGGEGNLSDGIGYVQIPDPLTGQLVEPADPRPLMIRAAATMADVVDGLVDPAAGPSTVIKSLPYGQVRIVIDQPAPPPVIDVSADGGQNWTRLIAVEVWQLIVAGAGGAAAQSIQVVTAGRVPREFIQATQPTAVQGAVAGDFWTKFP